MNQLLTALSNSWTALVFGAIFNLLAASPYETLIEFSIKTVIGGAIWFAFQLLADHYKNKNTKQEKNEHNKSNK